MNQYEKIKNSFEKKSFRYGMDVFMMEVLSDLMEQNPVENLSKLHHGAIFYSVVTMMNGEVFTIESDGVLVPEFELLNNSDKNLVLPAYLLGCISIDKLRKDDPDLLKDYATENDDLGNYRGPLGICIIFPERDGRLFYAFRALNPVDDTCKLFEIVVPEAATPDKPPEISILESDEEYPFWIDAVCHGTMEGISCNTH